MTIRRIFRKDDGRNFDFVARPRRWRFLQEGGGIMKKRFASNLTDSPSPSQEGDGLSDNPFVILARAYRATEVLALSISVLVVTYTFSSIAVHYVT